MLVSDPTVEKSAAALSVGLGAAADPDDYPGMAHYLEHMLFMGSAQYPDPDGFMAFTAEHGGMSNAYTGLDITNYMMTVENDAFPEGLDRFSSFFTDPLLDPTYIDKEKNAVNAEWSMRREQDFRIEYRLARKLLGAHPANRFQSGNLESLADKSEGGLHAATVAFFQRYYSANLMKASLISERPLDEMTALAEAYFADIPNKQVAQPDITAPIDFQEVGAKQIRYRPQDDTRELRLGMKSTIVAETLGFPTYAINPGGLAGVWAEENTRESIFDALERKETFGTSGTRIRVRLFGTALAQVTGEDRTGMILTENGDGAE